MKYYSSINLNKNELQNAVIHLVSSDGAITAPVIGQIIYDQSVNLIKYYDGEKWVAANDLEIQISGDSGSTTLLRDETLTFVGGSNLTSSVDSSDRVVFDLDPSITLASDITVPFVFVNEITGTDAFFVNLEVENIDAEVINSTDINTDTLNAVTINSENVNATDVTTYSLYADNGSVGTAVFSGTDVLITSNLTVASDLIVNGTITGNLSTSDLSGVIFSVIGDDEESFDVEIYDTLTFEGTEDEIYVNTDNEVVKIGIVTNPTLPGNVTITGDLTVQGTATYIDSEVITVKDPIIVLNSGAAQASDNTYDIGILGERGMAEDNVALFWDEDSDKFMAAYTSASGSDVQVLPIIGYADFVAADIEAASDVLIGGKITEYQGATPNIGEVLIGGGTGFTRGLITGASDTGAVVTSSTDSIVVSIDIDGATDGTGITVVSTDQLLLSDAGTEKRIHVGQLGSVFVRHDTSQSISASDQIIARTNIGAVEIITSTFTGNGTSQTFYFPHNLNNKNVLVQIFDSSDVQVYSDVNTSNVNYCSVTGNFASETFTVRIMGTRGTPLSVTSSTTVPV